jgi:alpha-amylase/alpha-mannosidase (GH57 family)
MVPEGKRFLIIHAHFYQPPRENPWTGEIAREHSAAPYHDWNERILQECYRPNSASRILDSRGRVLKIVNNYRRVSFNIGPTLAQWLESHAPEVYRRILAADKESLDQQGGHGNAIAQAYNHMILPLANERDLRTQILWGIADFRHRFGREPEAMWLPETAVNRQVLAALLDYGMRYVILSPYQARRIRRLDGRSRWIEVSGGRVDTSRPYRWIRTDGKGIDVLFYHGELSQRISFGDVLTNAGYFAGQVLAAFPRGAKKDQLVLIATDGETYGHHKPFGDMALSYMLEMELPKTDVQVTNPAAFLEGCRPEWEVEIDEGPDGRGSSWSCPHGVGRWYRDCGCSTGGQPGWHQRWRGPLREALDFLRDKLVRLFEEQGDGLFREPWQARDAYISVVLDRSAENVARFFAEHCPGANSPEAQVRALKLLEMQRHAMLMYTSCGWFFADISGLETVQILRYAARALELAEDLGANGLETDFLRILETAPSNLPDIKNGRIVWERFVRPAAVDHRKVVHTFAVQSMVWKRYQRAVFHSWELEPADAQTLSWKDGQLLAGSVRLRDGITWDRKALQFAEFHLGGLDFRGFVAPVEEGPPLLEKLEEHRRQASDPGDLLERLGQALGELPLRFADLLEEDRVGLIRHLFSDSLEAARAQWERVYQESEDLIEDVAELGYRLPEELTAAAQIALSRRVTRLLKRSLPRMDSSSLSQVLYWHDLAARLGLRLEFAEAQEFLLRAAEELRTRVEREWRAEPCVRLIRLIEVSRRLQIALDETSLQDWYWFSIRDRVEELVAKVAKGQTAGSRYVLASALLRLGAHLNLNLDDLKERLRPLEELLSRDPGYWP